MVIISNARANIPSSSFLVRVAMEEEEEEEERSREAMRKASFFSVLSGQATKNQTKAVVNKIMMIVLVKNTETKIIVQF